MEDHIIVGVIAVIVAAALISMVKRRGRKGCCGSGSDYKPRKKKLNQVIATKVFVIEGMHCEKCSSRVTEIINDMGGIAGVVDLKKGIATVSYEWDVPDEQIKARIEQFGYTVTEIR